MSKCYVVNPKMINSKVIHRLRSAIRMHVYNLFFPHPLSYIQCLRILRDLCRSCEFVNFSKQHAGREKNRSKVLLGNEESATLSRGLKAADRMCIIIYFYIILTLTIIYINILFNLVIDIVRDLAVLAILTTVILRTMAFSVIIQQERILHVFESKMKLS